LSVLLATAPPCAVAAQEKTPRLDAHGDSLPEAALARLGTLRLVHLGNITSVAVAPDGSLAASGVRGSKEIVKHGGELFLPDPLTGSRGPRWVTQPSIRLWDTKTGALTREIARDDVVSAVAFSSDGASLLAGVGEYFCCWDIASG